MIQPGALTSQRQLLHKVFIWHIGPDRRLFARLDHQLFDTGPAQIMPIWVIKIPPMGDVVAHS
jgi:hypothetical protein